jgi:DNA-binding CsgD family transcriptional regulator
VRIASTIAIDEKEQALLSRLARSHAGSVRLAERSRIILLAAQGKTNEAIAEELAISRQKSRAMA